MEEEARGEEREKEGQRRMREDMDEENKGKEQEGESVHVATKPIMYKNYNAVNTKSDR